MNTENLLADFLTPDEAAAELKVWYALNPCCEQFLSGPGGIIPFVFHKSSLLSKVFARAYGHRNSELAMTTENLLADFLTPDEAAAELKICQRTLDRWRRLGEGPPITKLGRRVFYRRKSLEAWLRAREQHEYATTTTKKVQHA